MLRPIKLTQSCYLLLKCLYQARKVNVRVLCVECIYVSSFYDCFIEFWKCSDNVVSFCHSFCYICTIRTRSYGSWIYNYLCNEYSIQHYVIKLVSDLRHVGGLFRALYFRCSELYQNRNKSWKPECVESFNMDWRILVFYSEPEVGDKIY